MGTLGKQTIHSHRRLARAVIGCSREAQCLSEATCPACSPLEQPFLLEDENMTIGEMKELVNRAISTQRQFVESMEDSNNPATMSLVVKIKGKVEALKAVEDALYNDRILLRLISH
ncbi:hypothetical protein LCGC14_1467010 [marine sediment metagenome]|uniref:Uncharacterized protein n=1 Tax=marine sediment metagenome TaxID=412755 RepID=A0A0F9JE30_9ZZZZ